MDKILKILHLEDLSADAEMVDRVLRKAQFHFEKKLVSDKEDFISALSDFKPDLILSDHSLPSFNSREAFKLTRELGISIPFILVTATVSEEYAVDVIKEGASDYILKDRLQRLPNAVQNAMDKYVMQRERILADEALHSSEQKYKLLFEGNPTPMWMISKKTLSIIDVNEAAIKHYGYTRDEFLHIHAGNLWSEKSPGIYRSGIWKHKKKDNTITDVEIISHELVYENEPALLILANDITEKIKAEAELARQAEMQQRLITEISIQGQEKEREEIGKELHDNINQILAATKIYLGMLLKKNEQTGSEYLIKSYENLNLAMEEIRRLSQSLIAPSLGDVSLRGVLQDLLGNISFASTLELELDFENYDEDITDNNMKLMFYRIVQEQLSNILKHAMAKSATVKLLNTPDQVELIIRDDGIGFDTSKKPEGIGLRNIKNRASIYNGVVIIDSAPGKGCSIKVIIPVTQRK